MTIKELFANYREKLQLHGCGSGCRYYHTSGGPGYVGFSNCTNENHKDVYYGGQYCPEPCPDFELLDDKCIDGLLSRFIHNYANTCEQWNKEYSIKEDDPFYLNCKDSFNKEYLKHIFEDL